MDQATRRKLVDQYKSGYRVVAEALAGATDAELNAHPAPGKWSAREIAHHLADSEMTSAIRLRRLLAEDGPQILGYDQDEYARRLHYDRPIGGSLEALKAARSSAAEILDRMTDAECTPIRSASRARLFLSVSRGPTPATCHRSLDRSRR